MTEQGTITKGREVKTLWGKEFAIVKNGLEEAEVISFVEELTASDEHLADKLKRLISLRELSQKVTAMVAEATALADRIKDEAKRTAEAEKARVLTEANQKAQEIISEAKKAAEEAKQEGQNALEAARETANLIEEESVQQSSLLIRASRTFLESTLAKHGC